MNERLTERIIGTAIEVHRILGQGLRTALIINFGEKKLVDGVKRVSL